MSRLDVFFFSWNMLQQELSIKRHFLYETAETYKGAWKKYKNIDLSKVGDNKLIIFFRK